MEPSSTGGRANWAGAAFELRLGVQFCVYILMGEYAGLAPGAARRVQFQAPGIVDDLVLEFDGATWAVQAKSGSSVRVEWNPGSPFGHILDILQGQALPVNKHFFHILTILSFGLLILIGHLSAGIAYLNQ